MKYETVYRAIQDCLDESGHGTATRADLAIASGVSGPTVYRAIQEFVANGLLCCEHKRGHAGGYLFGPPNRSNRSSQTDQTDQTDQVMPCLSQTVQGASPSEPEPFGVAQTDQTDQRPGGARWFVCCVWYSENGEMFCHGQDGYPTYIPCESKEKAMELAEEHHKMLHKGRPSHRASWPNVDVCEELFNGKQLHYRFVAVGHGLEGGSR